MVGSGDEVKRLVEHLKGQASPTYNEALLQPQVFVHRDFHSRNLLLPAAPGAGPGIIDFQDAVRGPVTYDLASLLRDCYVSWPPELVVGWARDFRRQLLAGSGKARRKATLVLTRIGDERMRNIHFLMDFEGARVRRTAWPTRVCMRTSRRSTWTTASRAGPVRPALTMNSSRCS